jgi:hypothetical protein
MFKETKNYIGFARMLLISCAVHSDAVHKIKMFGRIITRNSSLQNINIPSK